jgi:hypothetical protein
VSIPPPRTQVLEERDTAPDTSPGQRGSADWSGGEGAGESRYPVRPRMFC